MTSKEYSQFWRHPAQAGFTVTGAILSRLRILHKWGGAPCSGWCLLGVYLVFKPLKTGFHNLAQKCFIYLQKDEKHYKTT